MKKSKLSHLKINTNNDSIDNLKLQKENRSSGEFRVEAGSIISKVGRILGITLSPQKKEIVFVNPNLPTSTTNLNQKINLFSKLNKERENNQNKPITVAHNYTGNYLNNFVTESNKNKPFDVVDNKHTYSLSPTYEKNILNKLKNAAIKNSNSKTRLNVNGKKSTSSLLSVAKNDYEIANFHNIPGKKPSTSLHFTSKQELGSELNAITIKMNNKVYSKTNIMPSNNQTVNHLGNYSKIKPTNLNSNSQSNLNQSHKESSNPTSPLGSNINHKLNSHNINNTRLVSNSPTNNSSSYLPRKNSNLLTASNNHIPVSINNSNNTTQSTLSNETVSSLSNSPNTNNTNNTNNNKNLNNRKTENSNTAAQGISVSSLINNQNIPLSLSNLSVYFPFYESTKCSSKPVSKIRAYAANTYQGIIRNYNEDRVSIILNIARPHNYTGYWPKCSFFGIYDGHGGSQCADFLRDHLHSYVIRDQSFPESPIEALKKGFEKAEADFIFQYAMTKNMEVIDKSGSCAVVALIVEDICYVANVGDSRAVMSLNGGKSINSLTNDHKPNEEGENKRIIDNGGKVYQTQTPAKLLNMPNILPDTTHPNQVLIGPYRVFPGRLSVSRTFGDVEAKIPKFGGLPGVVIATPEITSFNLTEDCDFLVIGCDGIYDQMSNKDTIDSVWMTNKEDAKAKDIHSQCALGVDMIMKSSLMRRTLDNVTVLLIAFQNFENIFNNTSMKNKSENFSPKSSFYLYNAIENKESLITDHNNYYCNTEPVESNERNFITPSPLLKSNEYSGNNGNGIGNRYSRVGSRVTNTKTEKDVLNKVKSFSPKLKTEMLHNAYNVNKVNSNISNLGKERNNKVICFEVNNKIVTSPHHRNKIQYDDIRGSNSTKLKDAIKGKGATLKPEGSTNIITNTNKSNNYTNLRKLQG